MAMDIFKVWLRHMCLRGLLHKPLRHCKKLLSSYYISNSYAFYVSVFPAGEKFAFEIYCCRIIIKPLRINTLLEGDAGYKMLYILSGGVKIYFYIIIKIC